MEAPTLHPPPATSAKELPNDGLATTKQSKSRKRSAVSTGGSGQTQEFFFVDSGSSTREKRAHVMRHHIQAKRKQHMLANQADRQFSRGPRYLPWRKKSDPDAQTAGETPPTRHLSPQDESSVSDASTSADRPETVDSCHALVPIPGPVTMLSASRKDPFETLPVRLSPRECELVDNWTTRLSYWSGPNTYMKDRTFQAAMRNATTFQAIILGYCARWHAQMYDIRDDTLISFYTAQAEQAVNNLEQDGARLDEDTLALALTGLTLQEERFGSKQKAAEYAQRAVQVVRPRTGSNHSIEAILLYILYTMAPRQSTIPEDGARWLVTFLRSAERLMAEHNTAHFLSLVPQRATAFQFGSPLYLLLSSGPHPTQVPRDSRRFVVNKNTPTMEWSRTAALIYITTALWDYEETPSKTARFLDHLVRIAKKYDIHRYPACESFVWLLLEEGYEADMREPERAWSTRELLTVHKMLPPDLQFRFNEILLAYLMLTPPISGVASFERDLYAALT
ncbi:hypothetical protein VTN77DRAFT_2435 [Rasamsonia byssochlamydoides]|uniref:uncharacterized protein n=1 Tax=Rasamsonia byssochlamydoides TaxID=89139 RepID=UPI0037445807